MDDRPDAPTPPTLATAGRSTSPATSPWWFLVALLPLLWIACGGFSGNTAAKSWKTLNTGSPAERSANCATLTAMEPSSDPSLEERRRQLVAACEIESSLVVAEAKPAQIEGSLGVLDRLSILEKRGVPLPRNTQDGQSVALEHGWLTATQTRASRLLLLSIRDASPPVSCETPPVQRASSICATLKESNNAMKAPCGDLELKCSLESLQSKGTEFRFPGTCAAHASTFAATAYQDAFFGWVCSQESSWKWEYETGGVSACVKGIASAKMDSEKQSRCIARVIDPVIRDLTNEKKGFSASSVLTAVKNNLDDRVIAVIVKKAQTSGAWTHTTSRRIEGHHCTDYDSETTPQGYWAAKVLLETPRVDESTLAMARRVEERKTSRSWRVTDPGWI